MEASILRTGEGMGLTSSHGNHDFIKTITTSPMYKGGYIFKTTPLHSPIALRMGGREIPIVNSLKLDAHLAGDILPS
jgi:hypothetical protein